MIEAQTHSLGSWQRLRRRGTWGRAKQTLLFLPHRHGTGAIVFTIRVYPSAMRQLRLKKRKV
jgi:hypothetical protein